MMTREELAAVYAADFAARKTIAEGGDAAARAAASAEVAAKAFGIKKVATLWTEKFRLTEADAARVHSMMVEAAMPDPAIKLDRENTILAATLFFIDKEKPRALLERLAQIEVNLPEGSDLEAKYAAWKDILTLSAVTVRDEHLRQEGPAEMLKPTVGGGCLVVMLPLAGWLVGGR